MAGGGEAPKKLKDIDTLTDTGGTTKRVSQENRAFSRGGRGRTTAGVLACKRGRRAPKENEGTV